MKKYFIIILLLVLFTGCENKEFTKVNSITQYTLDKHQEALQKLNINTLKCAPTKVGGYRVTYYEKKIQNDFPATIVIEKVNDMYNVYFDVDYLMNDKQILLDDIDACMVELDRQAIVKKTWTDIN